jgi:hypothetical protein
MLFCSAFSILLTPKNTWASFSGKNLLQNASQWWRKQVLGFSFYHPRLTISKPLVVTGRKIWWFHCSVIFHCWLCFEQIRTVCNSSFKMIGVGLLESPFYRGVKEYQQWPLNCCYGTWTKSFHVGNETCFWRTVDCSSNC